MYKKIYSNVFFSMIPQHDVNLMYFKVVELEKAYLNSIDHFNPLSEFRAKLKIKHFIIKNVSECMKNV